MLNSVHALSSSDESCDELPDLATRVKKQLGRDLLHGESKFNAIGSKKPSSVISLVDDCMLPNSNEIYETVHSLSSDDEEPKIQDFTIGTEQREAVPIVTSKMTSLAKEEKLREKQAKKEEKEAKQMEKVRLKSEKDRLKLLKNATKPAECLKNMTVHIDRNLLERADGSELISTLIGTTLQYKIVDSAIPNTITFYRKDVLTLEETMECEAIIVVPVNEFVSLIYNEIYASDDTLCKKCKEWKVVLGISRLTLIVSGLDDYFRKQKLQDKRKFRQNVSLDELSKAKRKKPLLNENQDLSSITRIDVETALVAAQMERINNRLLESASKVAEFVAQVGKSISERPFKQQKSSTNAFGWYAEGSNVNAVKVDKSSVGLLKLWQQQLRQFNQVGIETAQAIAKEYHSPSSLYEAYLSLPSSRAEILLSDIPVRRGSGPLANTRRVGPELSKKIHTFFTCSEPSKILGQTTT